MDFKKVADSFTFFRRSLEEVGTLKNCRGIWITGAPGIGKTWNIMQNFSKDLFEKPQNQWWDGYCNERIVLIDDFDMEGG